jgi:hypothetical protein
VLRVRLLGFPRDRYPASALARWLLPSSGLGADLQKTFACLISSIVVWRHRAHVNVPSARCIATVRARVTESTAPELLAACVLRALPGSGSICQNIIFANFKLSCHMHLGFPSGLFPSSLPTKILRPIIYPRVWIGIEERNFGVSNRLMLSPVPGSYR